MKKTMTLLALLLCPAADATPYFRVLGFGSPIEQSAAGLFDIQRGASPFFVTDIAIVTHSNADGTLIPESMRRYVSPEAWSPLAVGGGVALNGDRVIHASASINLAPQIANAVMKKVTSDSPQWIRLIKTGLEQSGAGKIRIGWAEAGSAIRNGAVLPINQMFPGRGAIDILSRAGRLEIGAAWTY